MVRTRRPPHHPTPPSPTHQPFHRAPGHPRTFPLQLVPDLTSPIHRQTSSRVPGSSARTPSSSPALATLRNDEVRDPTPIQSCAALHADHINQARYPPPRVWSSTRLSARRRVRRNRHAAVTGQDVVLSVGKVYGHDERRYVLATVGYAGPVRLSSDWPSGEVPILQARRPECVADHQ